MKQDRVSRTAAAVLIAVAIALVLWQFVFKRDTSMDFSTRDLPASMKTTAPPPQITGVVPRRSPHGSPDEFAGSAGHAGVGTLKGPPGRQ